VELVPYNLLTYSEALTPNYTFNQCSITSNQTDPNGTSNAKRITNGATATDVYFEQSIGITNSVYTWSVYVKKGTDTAATIKPVHVGIGGDVSLMTFTFATETIATSGAITTSGFTSLGNGWYRIYCSVPITSAVVSLRGRFGNTNTPNVYNDWFGAQLVEGSTAKPYQKTETRLNIPRLDYSNGTCPSLLVEPQRTNLALQSNSAVNSTVNVGYSATDNNTTSPDGTTNAARVLEDTSTLHLIQKTFSVATTTTPYSVSFFVKANGRTSGNILYGLNGAPFSSVGATFNLSNGTITAAVGDSGATAIGSKIEDFGNGWFLVSVSGTIPTAGTHYVRLQDANGGAAGDPSKGFFVYGFQAEAGSYPTSYIPTTSASVTRNADVISKTGISSLIGQTEGTLFVEANVQSGYDANNLFITLSDGTSSNMIFINRVGGIAEYYIEAGGVMSASFSMATILPNGVHKLAVAYKQNDFVFYVDGVLINTDTSGNVPAMSRINLGSYIAGSLPYNDGVKAAALWKTRLTNAQLASLTTL
jgi:hypothetical protein